MKALEAPAALSHIVHAEVSPVVLLSHTRGYNVATGDYASLFPLAARQLSHY